MRKFFAIAIVAVGLFIGFTLMPAAQAVPPGLDGNGCVAWASSFNSSLSCNFTLTSPNDAAVGYASGAVGSFSWQITHTYNSPLIGYDANNQPLYKCNTGDTPAPTTNAVHLCTHVDDDSAGNPQPGGVLTNLSVGIPYRLTITSGSTGYVAAGSPL